MPLLQKGKCQCTPSCRRKPLPGSPFCKVHSRFCPRKSPLTGFEPVYQPLKYNGTRRIRDSHNCFAYAFDHVELPPESECNETQCSTPFHQPGRKSGYPKWHKTRGKRCPDLLARLRADIPGIRTAKFEEKCPTGTSKIALVIAPDKCGNGVTRRRKCKSLKNGDYHFYRQDSNGMWSHKPGSTAVTPLDATGRPIYDPAIASRDYGSRLNYKYFCSYLCAPKKKLTFKRGGRLSSATRRRISK
jgi:hypothetical protein